MTPAFRVTAAQQAPFLGISPILPGISIGLDDIQGVGASRGLYLEATTGLTRMSAKRETEHGRAP